MSEEIDRYARLRPPAATADNDICRCADNPPIVLRDHLSYNPISCLRCNLEVRPERVGFPEALAQGIAYWRELYRSFCSLWLDSREFEPWAKSQLENPSSPANSRGLALVAELNAFRRTYYWWFQDNSTDDFTPLSRCPHCGAAFTENGHVYRCEGCSIVVAN